jgi:hypothetical protein
MPQVADGALSAVAVRVSNELILTLRDTVKTRKMWARKCAPLWCSWLLVLWMYKPCCIGMADDHSHGIHASLRDSTAVHWLSHCTAEHNGQSLTEISPPIFTKTGTTIVGLCCKDGVVLGADTRSTGGPFVVDKSKMKISQLAPLIYSCAAGSPAVR